MGNILYLYLFKIRFIDKDLARNIFPKKNYYDDDYFEFLYYFNYKFFKSLIMHFTKLTGEMKKDMNKLKSIYSDFLKISEKFKKLKFDIKNNMFKKKGQLEVVTYGITSINTIFAIYENNLNDAQTNEIFAQIAIHAQNNGHRAAQSSSYQNQDQKNIIDKLQDMVHTNKK
jgi:hypothetical protein